MAVPRRRQVTTVLVQGGTYARRMDGGPILNREITDGFVLLRPSFESDTRALVDGRDGEFHRFIGEGSPNPNPAAVAIDADGCIVGWIDYDTDREWLAKGQVNIGYSVFPEHRGRGFARRSLELLMGFLAEHDEFTTGTLLIDPKNTPSIAVARGAKFEQCDDIRDQLFFKRPVRD